MRPKALARICTLAGLGAVVALAAPASSHPSTAPGPGSLPACTPTAASVGPPAGPARLDDPMACRLVTRVPESSGPARDNAPATGGDQSAAGYRHLGASSAGEWAGVTGRLTVTDPEVRAGSYDFLAARFMAKRRLDSGKVAWLEAGWAETGWSGDGRQRIYTYDTNGRAWRFYDEFRLSPGDQVWLDVHAGADGVWQAWLWWDDRWNLLSAETLPLGPTAQIEQYVEVHVDPRHPARLAVPPIGVAEVRLLTPDGAGTQHDAGAQHGDGTQPWREDVDTLTGDAAQERGAGLCLNWTTRYDTWSAGSCPPDDTAPDPAAAAPTPPDTTGTSAAASPATGSAAAASPATSPPGTGTGSPGTGTGSAADRPRGVQPADERPVDDEPATVIGDPAPAEAPLLPLLGNPL